jgi:1-acyl-sn-glycerol-3-phosphate acyltransferase
MIWLRSALFSVLALSWTVALSLLYLPLLLAPRQVMQRAAALWCRGLLDLVGVCCGLRWRAIGRENLPAGAVVIASKHQSAWDTLIFYVLLDDPVFVLKRELLQVPFVGWYMRKAGSIAVDRATGFRAIKRMLPEVDRALAEGAQVIVFPEGTRTRPGQHRPYHPGIAAIYARADAPVVPVSLNSGLFWSRRRFLKVPGVITLEILTPMPHGMPRTEFMDELERRIEAATERLEAEVAEARRGSPHPLAPLAPSPQGEGRGEGSNKGRAAAGRRTGS